MSKGHITASCKQAHMQGMSKMLTHDIITHSLEIISQPHDIISRSQVLCHRTCQKRGGGVSLERVQGPWLHIICIVIRDINLKQKRLEINPEIKRYSKALFFLPRTEKVTLVYAGQVYQLSFHFVKLSGSSVLQKPCFAETNQLWGESCVTTTNLDWGMGVVD